MGRCVTKRLSDARITEVFGRGMTPNEEAQIGGHGPEIAAKHYSEYEAKQAREKLPPDPLGSDGGDDAPPDARIRESAS